VIFLFGCGYKARARLVPIYTPKFGYSCRASQCFAELFGSLRDPYLSRANCIVGSGSHRSPVTKTGDGQCSQSRIRTMQRVPRNGGVPCPAITEERAVTSLIFRENRSYTRANSAEEAVAIFRKAREDWDRRPKSLNACRCRE
jgi:hypothetical protein